MGSDAAAMAGRAAGRQAGRPTVRQIYALAAVLCERAGEEFPQDRGEASALLDRLKGRARGGEPGGSRSAESER